MTFQVEAEEADSREPWGVYENDEAEREGAGPSEEKLMDMRIETLCRGTTVTLLEDDRLLVSQPGELRN